MDDRDVSYLMPQRTQTCYRFDDGSMLSVVAIRYPDGQKTEEGWLMEQGPVAEAMFGCLTDCPLPCRTPEYFENSADKNDAISKCITYLGPIVHVGSSPSEV